MNKLLQKPKCQRCANTERKRTRYDFELIVVRALLGAMILDYLFGRDWWPF